MLLFSGNKRKRLGGGGKKLTYVELDVKLLQWYRTKRTAPATTANVADIRKEKVTFCRLERCGRQISADLNHPCPSSKWFGRFLVRHRLSLQRPKRQQKIPLDEVHQKATSFYSFLRQASRWAPKRGAMGAFTSHGYLQHGRVTSFIVRRPDETLNQRHQHLQRSRRLFKQQGE